jgi:NTP pyrophosphatase (non-canonical NTP hydrolase)
MKNTESKIENWANERGILVYENRFVQLAKVMEEIGELAKAMIENDMGNIIDSLGDANITLTILSRQMKLSLSECTEIAYNEIKDRKGKTENGSFIKDK